MILNNTGSTVQTVGDVTEHQISIDAKNLEHIISILSTNLYSNPEQSFLREIVCNAIDAQVEAHSNEPAIISMAYDSNSGRSIIAIRDYGTGISPERFEEIYLNIGSSTKRESNDYIGSFGIGRFSALACADMVHITSYYKGTQYQYLMLKNGTRINVDLIDKTPTEEHDGVEVKISVDHLYSYRSALKYLWFVPNVYVNDTAYGCDEYDSASKRFNNRKLCYFKNFAYNNTGDTSMFVLLGNILYPVDYRYTFDDSFMSSKDRDQIWNKVIPVFNIGDLDITPNREQLLYSDKTKKALHDKYEQCKDELIELVGKASERKFEDIFEYYDATTESTKTVFLPTDNQDVTPSISLLKDSFLRPYLNYKYANGNDLANDKDIRTAVANFKNMCLDDLFCNVAAFEDGAFYTAKQLSGNSKVKTQGYFRMTDFIYSDTNQIRVVYVPQLLGIKSGIFKEYLSEMIDKMDPRGRMLFVFTSDKPSVRTFIRKTGFHVCQNGVMTDLDWHKSLWLLREIRKSIKNKVVVNNILQSPSFLKYKAVELQRRKEERKKNASTRKFTSRTRFYMDAYKGNGYDKRTDKIDVDSVSELVDYVCRSTNYRVLKGKDNDGKLIYSWRKVPVYWTISGDIYADIWKELALGHQAFVIITVAKTNAKYLEKGNLPEHWHRITPELILESKHFRKYMTQKSFHINPKYHTFDLLEQICDWQTIDNLRKINNWKVRNIEKIEFLKDFEALEHSFKSYYDQEMLAGYAEIAKYNQVVDTLHNIIALTGDDVTPLSMYVAMKKRLFRPKWEVYEKINKSLNPKNPDKENTDEENY